MWAICYRMTGRTSDADDLAQEAVARALARSDQIVEPDPTGWLLRIATTVCLDHLRRETTRRRATELVDWLDVPGLSPGEPVGDPERAAILRDDVRYAVIVALQQLPPRQRAALVLHDVCDRSIAEVAATLAISVNATKQLVHRARDGLRAARRTTRVDVPVDAALVEAVARTIEAGALDELAALLVDDAWGVIDGGGVVPVAAGPHVGRDAVMRRFANGWRRLDRAPVSAEIRALNGEPVAIVRLATAVIAIIHVESHAGRVVALRVDRDPRRGAAFAP